MEAEPAVEIVQSLAGGTWTNPVSTTYLYPPVVGPSGDGWSMISELTHPNPLTHALFLYHGYRYHSPTLGRICDLVQ